MYPFLWNHFPIHYKLLKLSKVYIAVSVGNEVQCAVIKTAAALKAVSVVLYGNTSQRHL